jgi:hypothetical protein
MANKAELSYTIGFEKGMIAVKMQAGIPFSFGKFAPYFLL